jgi:hypothetical protein
MAQWPWTFDARWIFIDASENPGIAQMAIGGRELTIDLVVTQASEHRQQRPPVRAQASVSIHPLVEIAGQRRIA